MAARNNNFKKGSTEMLLLHILDRKGDCYGYQLSQLIQQTSDGALVFPEGSLYPALYKLIDKQYVTDYKKKVGKRLTRVYYHIESEGIQHLEELKEDYLKTSQGIQKVLDFDFSTMEEEE